MEESGGPASLREGDNEEVTDGMPLLFRDGALEMEDAAPAWCAAVFLHAAFPASCSMSTGTRGSAQRKCT